MERTMPMTLPRLPYARNALRPHISTKTMNFHYGKHHKAYVTNLNNMIKGTDLEHKNLVRIIRAVANDPDRSGIFNNAAQVWNHTFYWKSMKPGGGGEPGGQIGTMIDRDFGSYKNFAQAFMTAGGTQFGSGWTWLVLNGDKLEVRKTLNAATPLTEEGLTPLLTMDVWEHAYYLDYQNARPTYMATFLEHLVNWSFAEENLG